MRHGYHGLSTVPSQTKALGNNKNNNSDNLTGCCYKSYFSNCLLLKWPDSILRQSFKGMVIWKHMNHLLWPFSLKPSANFSSPDCLFLLKSLPFLMTVVQAMNKKTGTVMCLSMNSRTFSFLPIFVSFWDVSLSDLLTPYPVRFLPIQHKRKHNLIISEQELLFLLKDSHLLSNSRNSYFCPRISIYYLDDEPKSHWNGNILWLWIRVVLLVILGSQEKVSEKTKRFRVNV